MRCQQRPGAEERGVEVEARHPPCQGSKAGMTDGPRQEEIR